MKFFIDSANINEIKELAGFGLIDGVTTNPSLVAKEGGKKFTDIIAEICSIVEGPVSAEVTSTSYKDMLEEGKKLAQIAENVCVKLPITIDGLKTCRELSANNIMTNMTLCFSATQALFAAKAGATFVSPFIGRWDDISFDGVSLIEDIRTIYDNYMDLETQILVASIRHPVHIVQTAKIGADAATIPAKILKQLVHHPLTDKGLEQFMSDWHNTFK